MPRFKVVQVREELELKKELEGNDDRYNAWRKHCLCPREHARGKAHDHHRGGGVVERGSH
eukprot:CAMPEP_0181257944 /NCGR_PEP_ID=MMETSP1096-20121128/50517_1 /TAXON_ID=156174 ORGANISM="Chrysochromulina ericina, Strain CCMP281" /NCGR_SAMPLE_ID=MMETSP1096 /ASSEMBLY_ACC=CAM_ASM_000453 /LENGTH=59 /DNA_ID=CAMNT_0023356301 /DNA_START=647 /DNA_END=826 /DNA_ORIENTATION=+